MQHITFLKLKKLLHNIPGGAVEKNLPASAGDTAELGLIPGSGRSPGVGNGNPLQYSCLESLEGYSLWDCKELDTTEGLSMHT